MDPVAVELLSHIGVSATSELAARPLAAAAAELGAGLRHLRVELEKRAGRIYAEFDSVGEFWSRGVDKMRLEAGVKIRVRGLVLPYGPVTPSHPKQRPGFTLEGWDAVGDLDVRSREAYDALDSIIYGGRVVRFTRPDKDDYYYGGLFDIHYGGSDVSVPLLIPRRLVEPGTAVRRLAPRRALRELWRAEWALGLPADVVGVVKSIPSSYASWYALRQQKVGARMPAEILDLPNFCLDVEDVYVFPAHRRYGATHIEAFVSWEHRSDPRLRERAYVEYFDCRDVTQWERCADSLNGARSERKKLLMDYDNHGYLIGHRGKFGELPPYNQMLDRWIAA